MKKMGYRVKKSDGYYKYYVKELQYDDIQRIRRKEVDESDDRPF